MYANKAVTANVPSRREVLEYRVEQVKSTEARSE